LDFRFYVGFLSEWLGVIATTWLFSISPRFQHPPLGFKYARRDGLVALSLSGVVILFSFLFYNFYHPTLPDPQRIAPAPVHELFQALFVAAICLIPFIIAMVLRQQPVRSLGWNGTFFRPGLQAGVALGLLTIFLRNRFMTVLGGLSADQTFPLLVALGVALAEETIFRGYIQQRLAWWLGPIPGILLTAVISTAFHLPVWLNFLPGSTVLILLGLTFVQSLVLGWVMHKTGHVIAPGIYRAVSIWMQFLG
jgi:membrane protease YdiL (CAAX protease family)